MPFTFRVYTELSASDTMHMMEGREPRNEKCPAVFSTQRGPYSECAPVMGFGARPTLADRRLSGAPDTKGATQKGDALDKKSI